MAASHRPGEITYYEELGVANNASTDDIRDAFRAVARLLHPDAQTDPILKEMAERQMRKLNRIHAVLSDPTRRTAYDASLNSRSAPIIVLRGSDGNLRKLLSLGGVAGGIVFVVFLLIWFALGSNSSSEVRGQEVRTAPAVKAPDNPDGAEDQIARLRDELRTAQTERDSALEQLGRQSGKQSGPPASGKVPAAKAPPAKPYGASATLTELPSAARSGAPPTAAPAATSTEPAFAASQFTGVWVYSKSAGSSASPGGQSLYLPEFIEVTVTQQNGALHGEYRSRYQVLDHAISPDVNFDFAGTPNGSALNCAWQGRGGARGSMTLRLLPASAVEIAWNATELGSEQWLANGTATLIRK